MTIDLAQVLHALGDATRLSIVKKIADSGPLSCGDVCCETPRSTLTHHLRILREAGVIHTTKQGQTHHNALRADDLNLRFPNLLKTILTQAV
ncbi:MAG: transcriptional regulator [Pseudomonas fluorescens]|nr:MAG: transcriptional regulator [Pseudomonas fluorescens]